MRVRGLFRLMVALLALGAAMAGPAAAARAMVGPAVVSPAMPCHETAADPGSSARAAPHALPLLADAGLRPPSHLCCVLSQAVVTPLAAPALALPEAVRTRPALPAESALAGLVPPIPVPPPRFL